MQADLGTAAGAIYRVLRHSGTVSLDWMCVATGLPPSTANRGIGWLARENKLLLEKRRHGREVRIRKAVGRMWRILRSCGPMSVERIRGVADLPADIANQGLGWLAREGRLDVAAPGKGRGVPIGKMAGTIWQTLYSWGTISKKEARKATGVPDNLLDQGIGWLVREGKVVLEDRRKKRDVPPSEVIGSIRQAAHSDWPVLKRRLYEVMGFPVNTTGREGGWGAAPDGLLSIEESGRGRQIRVGEAAGMVWRALHSEGPMSKEEICKETGLPGGVADQGIGWLAREDKLTLGVDRKGRERFRLKE